MVLRCFWSCGDRVVTILKITVTPISIIINLSVARDVMVIREVDQRRI